MREETVLIKGYVEQRWWCLHWHYIAPFIWIQ